MYTLSNEERSLLVKSKPKKIDLQVEELSTVDNGYLLLLKGDLDTTTVADFHKRMGEIIEKSPVRIIADFRELRYINSTGLGILLELSKKAQEQQSAILFCHVNRSIKEVMDLVGVTQFLDIYDTRDAAIASCN